jgi:class 3 adenylate cyclase
MNETIMAQQIEAVVAFADVSHSTSLYERLGDAKAREAIARCIEIMTEATLEFEGVVIKTIGDEVMSTFRTADQAAAALTRMQEKITDALTVDGYPLAIRAGFHFGPMILENGDVFGDAVNTAARVAGQAKAGQIMTTGHTVDQLSPAWKETARQIDHSTVRGKRDPITLFDLVRKREDATRMVPLAVFSQLLSQKRLTLRFGPDEAVVSSEGNAMLGRGDRNDLVVLDELVSRAHARVEYRRGRFVLVDQSVNGTCVVQRDGRRVWVRRDEYVLEDAGIIGLGREVDEGDALAISFELTS